MTADLPSLHIALSVSSPALSPVLFMSHWDVYFHLVFGHTLFLFPGISILSDKGKGSEEGDSSVFVLSRTGHFRYSSIHNSVNIIGRTFMLHLHGSCHICVSMRDQHFFVNNFNCLIYP